MKVSKAKFKLFEKTCRHWVGVFGLTQYRITFIQGSVDDGAYAELLTDEPGKVATFRLTDDLSKFQMQFLDVERVAKHEVCHLLTHRLVWLGESRAISCRDIDEEWEAVVRRLEGVL